MHRVIASTVRVVQSEACLDALSFARSPTIVPTWRMYFIRLLTTSGFPRWSWSLKLLLPAQPIRSTYPRSKVRARGGPTMMARLLPCRSRASEGRGRGSGSGAPIQALCCDAVGRWNWPLGIRADTYLLEKATFVRRSSAPLTHRREGGKRKRGSRGVGALAGSRDGGGRVSCGFFFFLARMRAGSFCSIFAPSHLTHMYMYIYTF